MKLHFEDWTSSIFLEMLDQKGLPNGGRIIKVFASVDDPRSGSNKPNLTVVEVEDGSLEGETFSYPDRGSYTGEQLEQDLSEFELEDPGPGIVRALFRFAVEHGFNHAAMAAKKSDESWLIDHPFGDIDGLDTASTRPARVPTIHLDIFFPDSLPVLQRVVDFDNPDAVMEMMEGHHWRKERSN